MRIKETLEKAGYISIEPLGENCYLLTSIENKLEIWADNPNHAGYTIIHNDLDLEFCRSV